MKNLIFKILYLFKFFLVSENIEAQKLSINYIDSCFYNMKSRSTRTPLYILDGMNFDSLHKNELNNILKKKDVSDIQRLDILNCDVSKNLYGLDCSKDFFVITTFKGTVYEKKKKKIKRRS